MSCNVERIPSRQPASLRNLLARSPKGQDETPISQHALYDGRRLPDLAEFHDKSDGASLFVDGRRTRWSPQVNTWELRAGRVGCVLFRVVVFHQATQGPNVTPQLRTAHLVLLIVTKNN